MVKPHGRGEALVGRYADDWGCAFRYRDDAEVFEESRAIPSLRSVLTVLWVDQDIEPEDEDEY